MMDKERLDDGKVVDVVYLDFSKAFDKVPHGRFVRKGQSLGMHVEGGTWIRRWLNGRSQRVVVEDCFSEQRTKNKTAQEQALQPSKPAPLPGPN